MFFGLDRNSLLSPPHMQRLLLPPRLPLPAPAEARQSLPLAEPEQRAAFDPSAHLEAEVLVSQHCSEAPPTCFQRRRLSHLLQIIFLKWPEPGDGGQTCTEWAGLSARRFYRLRSRPSHHFLCVRMHHTASTAVHALVWVLNIFVFSLFSNFAKPFLLRLLTVKLLVSPSDS